MHHFQISIVNFVLKKLCIYDNREYNKHMFGFTITHTIFAYEVVVTKVLQIESLP